jgi:predicted lipoprotein with Yx(FWY)xxD motif
MRNRSVAVAGFGALALLLAACGSTSPGSAYGSSSASSSPSMASSSPSQSASSAAQLKTARTRLGTVLVNASGFTLYYYTKDTATASACSGGCATAWPPLMGTPQAAAGVTLTGRFGTIMRSGGAVQATYNGHPLYTFASDTSPGQVTGNGAAGGTWRAAVIATGAAPSPSPTHSSGGYGY